jgi:hypothetical protein
MNTGDKNTGDWNTGRCNTGNKNTGDCNTGRCNTGNKNTGGWNTGSCNTGSWNTGSLNTGDCNTGSCNTGDWNTGSLNTTTPSVRLFNCDSGLEFNGEVHNRLRGIIYLKSTPICEWISAQNMTDDEKETHKKTWETTQGYLKVNDISKNNNELSIDEEEFLRSLPNFDEAILLECTGIDLSKKTVRIAIDGKEIQISREDFKKIKEQFLK